MSVAVSYTHLDVYKRQVYHVFTYNSDVVHVIVPAFLFTSIHSPVSYTHLDVYKRQFVDTLYQRGRENVTC